MIPKFVEAAISELQAMWPEGEHFPTIDWSGYNYRLMGKKHYYRSGKCPLDLYRVEINERISEHNRQNEEETFVPSSPFDKLIHWYKSDWSRITVAFEYLSDAEQKFRFSQYSKKHISEGGC